ncbi:hypothetical protein ACH0BF_19160 [Pseudobacillus sp. 179-B 2D1 NHS]|uniref:hypothetical protein n=1 Tax=Pseudobacillus sp. 179-B 2D1 NHS TaxID=3374292 RepID=UPI003879ACE1
MNRSMREWVTLSLQRVTGTRINVIKITIPPLREWREEAAPSRCHSFSQHFCH